MSGLLTLIGNSPSDPESHKNEGWIKSIWHSLTNHPAHQKSSDADKKDSATGQDSDAKKDSTTSKDSDAKKDSESSSKSSDDHKKEPGSGSGSG